MKGKIIIDVKETGAFAFDMRVNDVTKLDKLLLFDAMAEAFNFSEADREVVGGLILLGGLREMGVGAMRMEVPDWLADRLRRKQDEEG